MCGRIAITLPPEAIRAFFAYAEQPNFPPRYNIAPTQPVPVVRMERVAGTSNRQRHFVLMRWGFLPGFVKDPKDFPLVINARSETVQEKPSFRNALKRRRCIFIADAFYEWRRQEKGKSEPFLFRRRDGAPLALAGLWETWEGPNGEAVDTACVVTTHANGLMAAVHDRMPVILERDDFDTWLDCDTHDVDDASPLMRPCEDDVLEMWPISTAVNKVSNDGPDIQTRYDAKAEDHAAPPPPKARAKKPAAQGDLFG